MPEGKGHDVWITVSHRRGGGAQMNQRHFRRSWFGVSAHFLLFTALKHYIWQPVCFFFIWTTLSLENWHINYALLKTKSQWLEEGHSFSEAAELHQTFPDQRGRSVGPEETHGLHGVQHECQVIVQLVSAGYHILSVTSPLYWKTILNILM